MRLDLRVVALLLVTAAFWAAIVVQKSHPPQTLQQIDETTGQKEQMSIGVWQPQGVVIAPVSSDTPGQPNVLYETGAKVLSGTVFKMWFGSANGVCYAESSDGLTWTRYSGNPIIVPTGTAGAGWNAYPKIFKNGSTYYAYVVNKNFQSMSSWTSTDGVTWTQQVANAITPTQTWSGGATPNFIGQLAVLGQSSGTWYGYYTAYDSGLSQYAIGLATSSDLLNWTAYSGNPVITNGFPSNFTFQQVGSTYYGWSQIVQAGIPAFGNNGLPSDISRYSSPTLTGPWTGPLPVSTIYRTTSAMGVGSKTGQVADPSLISANGTTYMYATVTPTGNGAPTNYQIAAFTTSSTIAQLVQAYEGVLNVPFPSNAGLAFSLITSASDNFQRANANPIGGNWTTVSSSGGFTDIQLASNKIEPTGVNTVRGGAYWNAITWPADQWASSVIAANNNSASGSCLGVMLRASTSGAATAYLVLVNGVLGSGSNSVRLDKIVNGVYTSSVFTAVYPVNVGDTLTASIVGTQISAYINGDLVWTGTDSSIASGAAGAVLFSAVAVTDAQISSWSAGSVGSNTINWMNRYRKFVNKR